MRNIMRNNNLIKECTFFTYYIRLCIYFKYNLKYINKFNLK